MSSTFVSANPKYFSHEQAICELSPLKRQFEFVFKYSLLEGKKQFKK